MSTLSSNDPCLEPFKSLRAHKEHFIAEGEEVVRALLKSSLETVAVLALPKYFEQFDFSGMEQYVGDEPLMRSITGYKMHQGVMVLAKIPKPVPINALKGAVVALNGLADSENVGACLRNARAFNVRSVLVDARCSPPYLRRSVKVSRGAIFGMDIAYCDDLAGALPELKRSVIGADVGRGAVLLRDAALDKEGVYVFGSEGKGLEEAVRAVCDERVTIPIDKSVDSLNVAAASAILLERRL